MLQSRYPTLEEDHSLPISVSLKEADQVFEVSQAEVSVVAGLKGD